ncbi:BglG family transcription antiterminator [Anaerocolumna sp. AGMB13025]|uniref:BglG family transcription antiterminator n=1 Tax=Anaerocolumna sp. AGMB13025 TaxID=3039116 RepID=UPI00241DF907|nr:BglG family transcription antiterminator [Anaerocolumna sp. AGMB13025]WFR58459.1 BglG family transcription antiterminator [Anaerocolumna sp. AGMB13025]
MDFSPRLRQILLILLQEDQIVSVKKLADEIKVSKRTVQRELEFIDASLRKYKVMLQTKTGIGIWLDGEEADKKNLLSDLKEEDVIDSGDKEDRRKRLILEILKDRTPKKLYYYGNIFGVSEATISNDMEAIEDWFHQFDLKIIRKQGYGVALEGSEKNYRLAVRKFIDENIDTKIMKNLSGDNERSILEVIRDTEGKNIYNLINNEVLRQVITCFNSIRDKRLLRLTENSYIGLILHVTIAVNRILQEEIIEPNNDLLEKLSKDEDYDLALHIANSLEEEFQIEIPDIEVAYVLLHIKGSKLQYINEEIEIEDLKEREELLNFINDMIDVYDEELAYELKQDEEFVVGLLAHLQPTFIRLKNHMTISNPLLTEIKGTYPDIFKKCLKVGAFITKRYGYKVPEEEIGFLSMHFGAAGVRLENQKESKRRVDIGIVCASGIGISRLMHTKLTRYLKERAEITTYGKEDLTPEVLKKLDFLISSIKLEDINIEVIRVSPLLIDSDLEQIETKVRLYAKTPKRSKFDKDFSEQLEQVNFAATQIKTIINDFLMFKVSNFITFEELLVAVTEKLTPYNDRRLLIQEDIKRREKIASQVIPEYDFALLHTRTKGAVKPSFSVCVTKELSEFEDPFFMKVHAVIIMLIPDDSHYKENGNIMGHLSSRLIEDDEFLRLIFQGEKDRVQNYISRELKNYFNHYLDQV